MHNILKEHVKLEFICTCDNMQTASVRSKRLS